MAKYQFNPEIHDRIIVSLFDMTGNMVRPLAEAGYACRCYDIQNDGHIELFASGGEIRFIKADLLADGTADRIASLCPQFVFSFTPCTDLAVSGAKHFAAKKAKDPEVFNTAMKMFRLAEQVAQLSGCGYMIENPVSIASTLWRKSDHTFHPYEYGGYLPEGDIHPEWPQYITARDAYPKKTCLWTSPDFVMPAKREVPVDPGYSTQFKKLGGKSLKTKNIRSATPRGFARAVCAQLMHQLEMKKAA